LRGGDCTAAQPAGVCSERQQQRQACLLDRAMLRTPGAPQPSGNPGVTAHLLPPAALLGSLHAAAQPLPVRFRPQHGPPILLPTNPACLCPLRLWCAEPADARLPGWLLPENGDWTTTTVAAQPQLPVLQVNQQCSCARRRGAAAAHESRRVTRRLTRQSCRAQPNGTPPWSCTHPATSVYSPQVALTHKPCTGFLVRSAARTQSVAAAGAHGQRRPAAHAHTGACMCRWYSSSWGTASC
jgi:hypothetical protein